MVVRRWSKAILSCRRLVSSTRSRESCLFSNHHTRVGAFFSIHSYLLLASAHSTRPLAAWPTVLVFWQVKLHHTGWVDGWFLGGVTGYTIPWWRRPVGFPRPSGALPEPEGCGRGMKCDTVVHTLDRLRFAAQLSTVPLRRLLSSYHVVVSQTLHRSEHLIKSDKVWPAAARRRGLPIGLGLAR